MNKPFLFLLLVLCAVIVLAAAQPKIPELPNAVTSNAVVAIKGGIEVYSLMGMGTKKTWDDITNRVFQLRMKTGKWVEGRPVPGVAGRLGSSAIGAKDKIYVFGGYTVDGQGSESIVSDVNVYMPDERRWYRAADLPIPVDRAVIGVTHDRFIYIVGGRSPKGPVNNVQVYDVERNVWTEATPFPGTPVFGHAGGVADEKIVYVGGARKDPADGNKYVTSDECWIGRIDKKDPNKIEWSKLPAHPGTGRFGIVAGAGEHEHHILFSGGTITPYNFKGVDADGKPPEFSFVTFAFESHGDRWETIEDDTDDVRADTRGIAFTPIGPLVVGGMLKNSAISARVLELPKR